MIRALALTPFALLGASSAAPSAPRCVVHDPRTAMFVVDGAPVVCWSATGDCLAFGDTDAADRVVPHPAEPPPEGELRNDGTHVIACAGTRCRPLGPKVARVVKDLRSSDVQIARDLSVLAFSDTKERVFAIASDRELHLKPPARYGRQSPDLERVQVIGSTVVATWMSCAADGCVTSAVVDANGRNVGKALDGSVGVALDDRWIALAGRDGYGDLVVLDRAAHVLGRITFQADDVGDTAIARLAPDEVAIAWTSMGPSYHAARVRVGKKLAVGPIRDFAMCP